MGKRTAEYADNVEIYLCVEAGLSRLLCLLCVSVGTVTPGPPSSVHYISIFFSKHTRFTCPMPLNTQGVMPISL